ncbi:hypothetical protein Q3G72_016636 [Acer saccharum]|nr:hypothetical protein Q3G72_016636 [Acer saccharum]
MHTWRSEKKQMVALVDSDLAAVGPSWVSLGRLIRGTTLPTSTVSSTAVEEQNARSPCGPSIEEYTSPPRVK